MDNNMTQTRCNFNFRRSRLLSQRRGGQVILPLIIAAIALGMGLGWYVMAYAQGGESSWTTPVNVSKSGAASQPSVAVASNGRLHVLWWDAVEGEQYAQTTSVTGTTWTRPIIVPEVWGGRTVVTNTQTGRVTVSLTPPLEVRALSDVQDNPHILWRDVDNQLSTNSQTRGAGWGYAIMLADSATAVDAVADVKGTLHLAYIRALNSYGNPSGIYYRTNTSGAYWSTPVLVYASTYVRTARPEQIHVSVASDGLDQVLVVWDDPELGQSRYAWSTDGGRTWSAPQRVSASQANPVTRAHVASTSQGDFFLLWQDSSTEGCGLSQRRSTDGGQTWSAPERVLTGVLRCPSDWSSSLDSDGRLWLMGMSQSDTVILAAWDGKNWSGPVDLRLTGHDATMGRNVSLGCLAMTLASRSAGIVGCDTSGDIWAARNSASLDTLIPALKPVWSALETLSDSTSQAGMPSLAVAKSGKLYAVWSQAAVDSVNTTIFAATFEGDRWSRAAQILRSPDSSTAAATGVQPANKAEQPSLAADSQERLHAVWSSGTDGEIFYSRAYARDFASAQGWAQPVALAAPSRAASWPKILADPRGDVLHVIYAVPFNEARGIYYVRSNDGGTSWLTPTTVFNAAAAGWESADKPRLALDARANVLHAVWLRAQLPGGAHTQAVVYARSTDGGQSWSTPVKVAEGWVDWPQVTVPSTGQVYLIWSQSQGRQASLTEVWGQFSPDGGGRWTEPKRVSGFEQVSGPAGLSSDDAGGIHLVGVGRATGGEGALLHATWDGQAWTRREALGLRQNVAPDSAAIGALATGTSQLVVLVRGQISEQDAVQQFGIVATGRQVVVVQAASPAPTFTPLPTSTSTPTATPQPAATPKPQLITTSVSPSAQSGQMSGQLPLIVGGVLAVVVVLGVVIGRIVGTMRR